MLLSTLLLGQQVYEIPFASGGNIIELAVENSDVSTYDNLNITIQAPEWIKFDKELINISKLDSGAEVNTEFKFEIDKLAPLNEKTKLKFYIESGTGIWHKNITISVLPPEEFKLEQNYPNPFNPSTTIEYQLPEKSRVDIRIYNLLGELVEHLTDDIQQPGLHKVEWKAESYASGIYIYQVYVQGREDRLLRKKMMLVK